MAAVQRDSFLARQYLLGVAGMATMRRVLSQPSEGLPRIEEILQIVAAFDDFPNNIEIEVVEHDVESGYTAWAPSYDGPNAAIDAEEPVVRAMIAELPPGRAIDAACGTGRHAAFLAEQGFETIGVDASNDMLDIARKTYRNVDFRQGRLEELPAEAGSVDLVTAALAICHVADITEVFAEFARVVAPGGTVIVSDPHPTTVQFGGVAGFRDPDADPADGFTLNFVPNLHHPMHTYVNAAVAVGFEVVECREPVFPEAGMAANPAFAVLPDAVRQAFGGLPFIVVWRFRKPA